MVYGGLMGTTSGVAAGLAATDPKLVPYGAVAAAVVVAPGARVDVDSVRQWGADRMARYTLPKQVKVVPSLPRNAMGKVSKADVKRMFAS